MNFHEFPDSCKHDSRVVSRERSEPLISDRRKICAPRAAVRQHFFSLSLSLSHGAGRIFWARSNSSVLNPFITHLSRMQRVTNAALYALYATMLQNTLFL